MRRGRAIWVLAMLNCVAVATLVVWFLHADTGASHRPGHAIQPNLGHAPTTSSPELWLEPRRGVIMLQRQNAPPAAPPHNQELPQRVACPLPDQDGSSGSALVRREDGTLPDPPWVGTYDEAGIELYVFGEVEAALVEMRDRTLLLTWDAAECVTTVVAENAGIHGVVHGSLSFPESWVHGCGSSWPIDQEGRFFVITRSEPCKLRVVARDHGRAALGPPVDVLPRMGVDIDVVLEAPKIGDLTAWTDAEYTQLLSMIEVSRELVQISPEEPQYAEILARFEAEREEVEAARSEP